MILLFNNERMTITTTVSVYWDVIWSVDFKLIRSVNQTEQFKSYKVLYYGKLWFQPRNLGLQYLIQAIWITDSLVYCEQSRSFLPLCTEVSFSRIKDAAFHFILLFTATERSINGYVFKAIWGMASRILYAKHMNRLLFSKLSCGVPFCGASGA